MSGPMQSQVSPRIERGDFLCYAGIRCTHKALDRQKIGAFFRVEKSLQHLPGLNREQALITTGNRNLALLVLQMQHYLQQLRTLVCIPRQQSPWSSTI